MNVLEKVIDVIAPHCCVGCGSEGSVLCEACAQQLPEVAPRCYRCGALSDAFAACPICRCSSPLIGVWAATTYDDVAKIAVSRLKFERAQSAAYDIAQAMASRITLARRPAIVTHVPTANTRKRQRGYDQALHIARELAHQLNMPYASLLARIGSARQVGASGVQRREQLNGAFRPLKPYLIQNADIVLVDDVITTGSTLEAAARTLQAAGAARVSAAVFAQA